MRAAASSHGLAQNTGPHSRTATVPSPDAAQAASRPRACIRSSSMKHAPSRANRARALSSRATRLSTIALPSIAISPPAIVVSSGRWNSKWAANIVTATSRMPVTAIPIRQPQLDSAPNAASPAAMIHLPSGG